MAIASTKSSGAGTRRLLGSRFKIYSTTTSATTAGTRESCSHRTWRNSARAGFMKVGVDMGKEAGV